MSEGTTEVSIDLINKLAGTEEEFQIRSYPLPTFISSDTNLIVIRAAKAIDALATENERLKKQLTVTEAIDTDAPMVTLDEDGGVIRLVNDEELDDDEVYAFSLRYVREYIA